MPTIWDLHYAIAEAQRERALAGTTFPLDMMTRKECIAGLLVQGFSYRAALEVFHTEMAHLDDEGRISFLERGTLS